VGAGSGGGGKGRRETRWEKGHGRIEEREVLVVEAKELGAYLDDRYAWPGVRCCGVIRRRRWKRDGEGGEDEEQVWVSSVPNGGGDL